ncbi:MAG: flagellar basal body rod protein FlgF [Gammaproteobacteria bacterium]|nr:flagellar basal body rod protein FlgF [Gammaproteobacteria bacterium]
MDRMLYTAMTGAQQIMLRQTSNNNNLANTQTTGFRQDLDTFKDLPLYGPGWETRVLTELQSKGVDMTPGAIMETGRSLDVAAKGNALIAIQAKDGKEAYTRAGALNVNANGMLETSTGQLVIGNGGPISVPPYENIAIAADGSISVQPLGQAASTLAILDRLKLVSADAKELVKTADGHLRAVNGKPLAVDAFAQVQSGALETSNVNTVEALVNMIALSRQFELNVKLMETTEKLDEQSASRMTLS